MTYLLFILISFACFFWLVGSEAEEFFLHELAVFSVVFFVVVAVQCLVVWLIERLARERSSNKASSYLSQILLFGLTVANAYSFCFGEFQISSGYQWLMALLAGGVFLAAARAPSLRNAMALFAGIFILMSLYNYAAERIGMASASLPQATQSATFRTKPNVYAISFESLLSPHALDLLYGGGKLPHFDYLKKRGFRVLERAYSGDSATIPSLARMLEYDAELQTAAEMRSVFGKLNTTYAVFKNNGYQINFMYVSNHLGTNKGGADYFFPIQSFSTCYFLSEHYGYFACEKGLVKWVNRQLFSGRSQISNDEHIQLIKDRADAIMATDQPGYIFSHVNFPAHTLLTHDYRDRAARAAFVAQTRQQSLQVANYFKSLFDHIIEQDPAAIVLVYGDHGAWMSRGMTQPQVDQGNEFFSHEEAVEDRHGVALAVYPKTFCQERIRDGASTLGLMKNLIACLSGHDSMSDVERHSDQSIYYEGKRADLGSILR